MPVDPHARARGDLPRGLRHPLRSLRALREQLRAATDQARAEVLAVEQQLEEVRRRQRYAALVRTAYLELLEEHGRALAQTLEEIRLTHPDPVARRAAEAQARDRFGRDMARIGAASRAHLDARAGLADVPE